MEGFSTCEAVCAVAELVDLSVVEGSGTGILEDLLREVVWVVWIVGLDRRVFWGYTNWRTNGR